jgi:2-isopropylmalate synthase
MPVSDTGLAERFGIGRADAVRAIQHCIAGACGRVPAVQFTALDVTCAERPFLRQCIETAILAGADRVSLDASAGCRDPADHAALVADIVQFVGPGMLVSSSCRGDRATAVADTVAAVRAGAGQIEVATAGGAAGADAEAVGLALRESGAADTGLDLGEVGAVSRRVADLLAERGDPVDALAASDSASCRERISDGGSGRSVLRCSVPEVCML